MGIFRKAGKRFEEAKRTVLDAAEADFVCASCEEPVEEAYEYCPHCGEDAVEPVE